MFDFFPYSAVDVNYQTDDLLVGTVKDGNAMGGTARHSSIAIATSNLTSLYTFLQDHCPTPQHQKSSSSSKAEGGSNFYFFDTYEQAMETYSKDPASVRSFTAREDLVKIPDNMGNDVQHDVWGDFVDIGNYLMGVPEVFGRFSMGNPLGLFATITLTINAAAFVDNHVINHRAERIVRLVDWLEMQQIRTKISAISYTECEMVEIGLKQFEDSLDLNSVAVVAHSDFLRRLLFRVKEYSKTWSYGYGTALRLANYGKHRKQSEHGIALDIDWFSDMQDVDKAFDIVEADITTMLEEQGRHYHKIVKPNMVSGADS